MGEPNYTPWVLQGAQGLNGIVYNNVDELAKEIYSPIQTVTFIKGINVTIEGPILKARLLIEEEIFINVFFNSITKTTSYPVIKNNERILGIDKDSIRNWHKHNFDQPGKHDPCNPTRLKEFIVEISKNLEKILP